MRLWGSKRNCAALAILPRCGHKYAEMEADIASYAPWTALRRRYPDLADTAEEIVREDQGNLLDVHGQLICLLIAPIVQNGQPHGL